MRQLLPHPVDDVNPEDLYSSDLRPSPPGRPWVVVNMISSVDGAASIGGASGALGGPADRKVFRALRAVPDVILVGAGTVAAETYGSPKTTADQQRQRVARGQQPVPRIAVVSGRLTLDPTSPLFTDAVVRPLIITGGGPTDERLAEVGEIAEVIVAPGSDGHRVDLAAALAELAARGVGIVLCEGGPTLNGQLAGEDLIDELDVTISPLLVADDVGRIVHGPRPLRPDRLRLDRVLEEDDLLMLRYVRR